METYPDIILDAVVNVTPYRATGSDPLLFNPQPVSRILANGSCEKVVFSYLKGLEEPIFDFGFRMGIVFKSNLSVRGMEIRSTLRAQIDIVKRIVAAFQI